MIIMRPVRYEDLDQLVHLGSLTGFGLSTLPADREYLEERVHESMRSFKHKARKPRGDVYLLVMEDLDQHRVIGTSGIVSKVGGFEPFYAYRIERQHLKSEVLKVDKEMQLLKLVTEHNGPCEIGSLFLHPDYQRRGLGRLLSCSRFLFMAEFPDLFESTVIAELRGDVDERGHSPFWEALGRHFFNVDFPKADYLSMKNKKFIAELMPQHPIYIPLLPKEARAVIGEVNEKTVPALNLLHAEGFHKTDMVDIFEAGPIVGCRRDAIRTVRQSARGVVHEILSEEPDAPAGLISNTRYNYLACRGRVEPLNSNHVRISRPVAGALNLHMGDAIRYATFET
jgi:arginine N-succinyltransferase